MKRILITTIIFLSGYLTQAQQWEYVGNQGISSQIGYGYNQCLTVDTNGIPYVAYIDMERNFKVSVIAYTNNNWDTIGNGGFSLNPATINNVKIKINPVTNNPYVLFTDDGFNNKACLMYFNGTIWDTAGNYPFTSQGVIQPDLSFSSGGIPYVSFGTGSNVNGNMELTVMKFENNTWSFVGDNPIGLVAISYGNTDIEVSSQGNPYVIFKDGNGNKASVKYYDDNIWKYYGDSLFSQYSPSFMDLEFDNQGNVYVAYKDDWITFVKRWNENNWETVGSPFPSTENCYYLDLEITSTGDAWIAYKQDNGYSPKPLRVQRFDGTNWSYVGETNVSEDDANFVNLEFDKNDVPYVAFQDGGYYNRTSVMKFDYSTSVKNKNKTVLKIFPNPACNNLFISYNSKSTIFYGITDITGRTLKQGIYYNGINISDLTPGVYFINLSLPNGIKELKKFIKI